MSVTTAFGSDLLSLILTGTAISNIADNAAASPITSWYLSLHTASPGASGNQATSEAAYTGYARVAITRDTDGWTVSSASGSNDAQITFGQCTASPGSNITHVGIGTASTGSGSLKLYGSLTNAITMQVGATPIFSIGELDITCS
jgi:hypothetical protein